MKAFITAGEPSGDKLGAALIAGLRQEVPDIQLSGVAGPLMQAQGQASLFPMSDLSVMGIAEVLPKYRFLKRRIAETAEAVIAAKPDVLITIDSPDFSLRVAKLVKAASDIPTVHYVAPTVWAWRAGRAAKMARHIDHVLALFPFEPPYMTDAGMSCDFVGHPVVAEPKATAHDIQAAMDHLGLSPERPLVLVLPGSRRSEVARMGPVFLESLTMLREQHPEIQVAYVATEQTYDALRDANPDVGVLAPGADLDVFQRHKRALFAAADVALAASGTVSLELAAAGTPMVIAYDMNPLSRFLIGRMLKIDTVTLVNLVSETRTVPEFLGQNCRAELIVPALSAVLQGDDAQKLAMAQTMQRLGCGDLDPGLRAAQSVVRFVDDRTI
ncbi:lipid-A-disaccharide synthase [Algirhabdus cladophorae]|uniref:lipid-A-disaccharide synthase n=1 Tax=Algirhabdus cladophorae TaxID=3377108 RepID=UPI003B845B8B